MAIKKFSKNTDIPVALNHIPRIELAKKYCVGRFVNDVPLGLIIYAGRNQFNHLDAQELFEPSKTIFTRIGQIGPSRFVKEPYQDPAFDLNNRTIINFASNITALIGWRNYNTFENDMIEMLEKY